MDPYDQQTFFHKGYKAVPILWWKLRILITHFLDPLFYLRTKAGNGSEIEREYVFALDGWMAKISYKKARCIIKALPNRKNSQNTASNHTTSPRLPHF